MEQTRARPVKIQIVTAPERICAAGVEESAAAMALLGHDIGIGCRGFGGSAQVTNVNIVVPAILQDLLSQGVFADEAGAIEREGSAGFSEVYQHIVRSPAGAL